MSRAWGGWRSALVAGKPKNPQDEPGGLGNGGLMLGSGTLNGNPTANVGDWPVDAVNSARNQTVTDDPTGLSRGA